MKKVYFTLHVFLLASIHSIVFSQELFPLNRSNKISKTDKRYEKMARCSIISCALCLLCCATVCNCCCNACKDDENSNTRWMPQVEEGKRRVKKQ